MARKKTDKVVEHRITFGDYERKELKQTLDGMQINSYVNTAKNAIVPIAIGSIIGFVGYLGVKAYAAAKTIWNDNPLQTVTDTVKDTARKPFDFVAEYTGIDLTPDVLQETVEYDPSTPGPGKYYWPPTGNYEYAVRFVALLSEWQQTNGNVLPDGVTEEEVLQALTEIQGGLANLGF